MRALFRSEKALSASLLHPLRAEAPRLRSAELASAYHGRRMAGDFYDFVRVSTHRVLFGLLDAAGDLTQTRAALSAAQHTFRTAGPKLLAHTEINTADAMMELCLELNQALLEASHGVRSCPAFAGCYDETLGVVCYFNAGHTPGLVRDHAGVHEVPATSLPLGLFSHMLPDARMIALEPGAALLLSSRGIVEGKRKSQEFGLEAVKTILQHSHSHSAKQLCDSVLEHLQQFMRTAPTHDDVTAVALARSLPKASA
jgi:serine phosphatase RsbU (regulator of sigma subunit)